MEYEDKINVSRHRKDGLNLTGVPAPFGDVLVIHRLFNLLFYSKSKIVFLVTNNSFVTNNSDGKNIEGTHDMDGTALERDSHTRVVMLWCHS